MGRSCSAVCFVYIIRRPGSTGNVFPFFSCSSSFLFRFNLKISFSKFPVFSVFFLVFFVFFFCFSVSRNTCLSRIEERGTVWEMDGVKTWVGVQCRSTCIRGGRKVKWGAGVEACRRSLTEFFFVPYLHKDIHAWKQYVTSATVQCLLQYE